MGLKVRRVSTEKDWEFLKQLPSNSLLDDPKQSLRDAIMYTYHMRNQSPYKSSWVTLCSRVIPYETLSKKKPPVSGTKEFSCLAWVHVFTTYIPTQTYHVYLYTYPQMQQAGPINAQEHCTQLLVLTHVSCARTNIGTANKYIIEHQDSCKIKTSRNVLQLRGGYMSHAMP